MDLAVCGNQFVTIFRSAIADLVGCVTQRAFLFLIVKLIKYFIKLKLKYDRVGINLVRSPSL